jgi:hypothetical protein
MMKSAFLASMTSHSVRPDAYSIGDYSADECYVALQSAAQWLVFYSQRGVRSNVVHFSTEEDALDYLNDIVLKDASTRLAGP